MTGRFFAYAAGPFLVAYVLLLLGLSYVSQQNLRQASHNALLFNIEKRASAVSYFHSERRHDITTLAKDRALSVFFSNRDLGMSMEHGLDASLLSMQEIFQEIFDNKTLNQAPIYLRLLFIENQGNQLVDVGLLSGKPLPWLNKELLATEEMATFIFQNGEHIHSIISCPYHYKGNRVGTLLAEINRDEMIRFLIHPQPSEHTQYTVIVADSKYLLNLEDTEQQAASKKPPSGILWGQAIDESSSFVKKPIPGTPFILAARYQEGALGAFFTSRWYLISLIVLALIVLYSVVIGIRSRTQTLLLHARFEESEQQSVLLNEQNRLLEREIQKRRNSEAHLQTLIETIPDLLWLKSPEGFYLSCNHKFERLFGAKETDILGKTDYNFVDRELADFFQKHDKAAIAAGKPLISEERMNYADDGHEELLETIRTPLRDSDGKLIGVLGLARDITARKQAEEKALYLSVHDPLTGLYNRRVLEERLTGETNRSERYERSLSIFMLDVDHFKQVNDTHGHRNGDMVLCHLAKLLETSVRKTDYVARYGGEEFIVVLPETPLYMAKELAERLCEQISRSVIAIAENKTITITVSIGVATFPEHSQCWEELIEAADSAMYVAKQAGRNQVKLA